MNTPTLNIHSTVPVISTLDIQKSLSYYVNVLGFSPDFEFGDPVTYAGVKSGEAEIYFAYDPDVTKFIEEEKFRPEIFIWLTNIDNLFDTHVNNGANIVEPISDRPWGARQYVVKEVNGYHLKFAQPI